MRILIPILTVLVVFAMPLVAQAPPTEDLDPAGEFERQMSVEYPASERHTFEGVTVWHIGRRAMSD